MSKFFRAVYAPSTNQSLITATKSAVQFSSTRWDSDSMFSVSNNTRLTCKTAGTYSIGGWVSFTATAITIGYKQLEIRLNGSTIIARDIKAGLNPVSLNPVTSYRLSVGDYVELIAYQTLGVNLGLLTDPLSPPEFWAELVG